MSDDMSQSSADAGNGPKLIPGVGLWGRGYVLRLIQHCLLPHRGERESRWKWMQPALVDGGERLLPQALSISHNHHIMQLKKVESLAMIDVDVVKPSVSRWYDKAVLLVQSVTGGQALKLVISSQPNVSPTRQYCEAHLVCIHARDEELILGATAEPFDIPEMWIALSILVENCPDIGTILPVFNLQLTQAGPSAGIEAIIEKSRLQKEVNSKVSAFRESLK